MLVKVTSLVNFRQFLTHWDWCNYHRIVIGNTLWYNGCKAT